MSFHYDVAEIEPGCQGGAWLITEACRAPKDRAGGAKYCGHRTTMTNIFSGTRTMKC